MVSHLTSYRSHRAPYLTGLSGALIGVLLAACASAPPANETADHWQPDRASPVAERSAHSLDESERLQEEIVEDRGPAVAAGDRASPTNDHDTAQYTLDTAAVDLGRASEVGAEMRAPLLYTKAKLAFDTAMRHVAGDRHDLAVSSATEASRLARAAYAEALPHQQRENLEAQLRQRRDALMGRLLGIATPVVSEGDISVSLVGYFIEEGDRVRDSKASTLQKLAEIASEFPEYGIKVVGHTGAAGEPTHNLMVSQAQAMAVRQSLEDHGVDRDRLTSVGEGESDVIDMMHGDVANSRIDVIFEPLDVHLVREPVTALESEWDQ